MFLSSFRSLSRILNPQQVFHLLIDDSVKELFFTVPLRVSDCNPEPRLKGVKFEEQLVMIAATLHLSSFGDCCLLEIIFTFLPFIGTTHTASSETRFTKFNTCIFQMCDNVILNGIFFLKPIVFIVLEKAK